MGYEWLKLYSHGILRGSIVAQMTLEEQMVWVKLLCFASECRDRGVIRRAKGIPFERGDLARHLGVTEELLNITIDKCLKDENADDPTTRIMILPDGSLAIANWEKYQGTPPRERKNNSNVPLDNDDKKKSQELAATKLGFLQPEAAQKGIERRKFEDHVKETTKQG